MAIGIGLAAAAPNVWIAAACVIVSGVGNGAAVVCNAVLVQRGAPDAMRGRVFTVLMSSNYAVLGLGMVLAGPTDERVRRALGLGRLRVPSPRSGRARRVRARARDSRARDRGATVAEAEV